MLDFTAVRLSAQRIDQSSGRLGIWLVCAFTFFFTFHAFKSLLFFLRVKKPISRIDLLQRGVISANGSYLFKVVARDQGNIPLLSNTTVDINIVDVGDDSPVFNR